MIRRRARRAVRRTTAFVCAVLIGAAAVWIFTDVHLRPVVESYSRTVTEREASLAVDRAVTEALDASDTAAFLRLTRAQDGTVQSVETDMYGINRMKAHVTEGVAAQLSGENITLRIPIGTLTGSDLLTGRGPCVPIRINRRATAVTSLETRFTDAGVNQTNHQLWLTVDVTAVCAVSGFRQLSVTVKTEHLIAETVLVGIVPDIFTDKI